MTPHEKIEELLPLSAAGVLGPEEERTVRQHIRECAECARRLEAFASLSAGLGSLPAPPMPPDLAARTAMLVSAELAALADRRRGALLAAAAGLLGWLLAAFTIYLYEILSGGSALVCVAWITVPAFITATSAAALFRSRHLVERSSL
jgi:anti-sigma factor RsiW